MMGGIGEGEEKRGKKGGIKGEGKKKGLKVRKNERKSGILSEGKVRGKGDVEKGKKDKKWE